MKHVQHTPGEWSIAKIDGGASDDEVVTVVDGCLVNIASVFGPCEYSVYRTNGEAEPRYEVCDEESIANGRLIASAPELLSLVVKLDTILRGVGPLYASGDVAKDVRAAIEKATEVHP